jgi:c-di-GMP-binding flagellar brake protein YcgR
MSDTDERRVHSRMQVQSRLSVLTDRGPVEGALKDLSLGGALFVVPRPVGAPGSTIDIEVPDLSGNDIAITAEIIRSEPTKDPIAKSLGGQRADARILAVRFSAAEPTMRQRLQDLIEVLTYTKGAEPGVAGGPSRTLRRMDVQASSTEELISILEEVALGGLAMTVDDPLVFYEQLEVTMPDLGGSLLLTLRAKVVYQRAVSQGGVSSYRVGLEFANMRLEARRCLEAIIYTARESLPAR